MNLDHLEKQVAKWVFFSEYSDGRARDEHFPAIFNGCATNG
jgi:hypothetical protein